MTSPPPDRSPSPADPIHREYERVVLPGQRSFLDEGPKEKGKGPEKQGRLPIVGGGERGTGEKEGSQ